MDERYSHSVLLYSLAKSQSKERACLNPRGKKDPVEFDFSPHKEKHQQHYSYHYYDHYSDLGLTRILNRLFPWISGIRGIPGCTMVSQGYPWISVDIQGYMDSLGSQGGTLDPYDIHGYP